MQLALLFLVELYTLFQLWFVSTTKKISWKSMWVYLWVGTLAVTAVTLCIHMVTTRVIPPGINSYTVNPLVEEAMTILPVVILVWKSGIKEELGIFDCMLLGAALGCGFTLMETGIRIIGATQQWTLNYIAWSNMESLIQTWLPERMQYPNFHYAGHGIAGALTGLGVGFWHRYKKWGWVVLLLLFGWTFIDHSFCNYTISNWGQPKRLLNFFWNITGRGRFMPWAIGSVILWLVVNDIIANLARWEEKFSAWKYKLIITIQAASNRIFWKKMTIWPLNYIKRLIFIKWTSQPWQGRLLTVVQSYFWFSLCLVFFLNGIMPRCFYSWYLGTPFWWLAGVIGNVVAIWAVWRWFQEWRSGLTPVDLNGRLIFYGRAFLSCTSFLYVFGSLAIVALILMHHPFGLFELFLYYAAGTFANFFLNGFASALGVLNGLCGFVSNAYGQDKPSKLYQLPSGINKKPEANIDNLRPEMQRIIPNIIETRQKHGANEPLITSGNDGDHGTNSLHYRNLAIDLRGNDLDEASRQAILKDLKKQLGSDYDVIIEPEKQYHFHIEYDPKGI